MEGAAVLPGQMVTVPACVFSRCTKLQTIAVETLGAGSAAYTSENGLLYTADKKTLVAAPLGVKSATFAPETSIISSGAFWGARDLSTIVVNGIVEGIEIGDALSATSNDDLVKADSLCVLPKDAQGNIYTTIPAFNQNTTSHAQVVLNVDAKDKELASSVWQNAGFTNFAEPATPGTEVLPSTETVEGKDGEEVKQTSGFAFTLLDDYTLSVRWEAGTNNEQAPQTIDIPTQGTLNDITYPVSTIGDSAFKGQSSIEAINIPSSITSIGKSAFEDTSIQAVSIPGSVTSIGDSAFANCENLVAVELTDGLEQIGESAFAGIALETLVLPASVKSVGDYAFANSPNLNTILSLGSISEVGLSALASNNGVKIYVPYNEQETYAWSLGTPAANNHLLPYGVRIQEEPITLEEGETANLYDNGGYLEVPEGFEVNYSYKAKPVSVDTEGNVEAKQVGSSNVEVSISIELEQVKVPSVTNQQVKLEQSALQTELTAVPVTYSQTANGSLQVVEAMLSADSDMGIMLTADAPYSATFNINYGTYTITRAYNANGNWETVQTGLTSYVVTSYSTSVYPTSVQWWDSNYLYNLSPAAKTNYVMKGFTGSRNVISGGIVAAAGESFTAIFEFKTTLKAPGYKFVVKRADNGAQVMTANNEITVTTSSAAIYTTKLDFWSNALIDGNSRCYAIEIEHDANHVTVGWRGSYDLFSANHVISPGDVYTAVVEQKVTLKAPEENLVIYLDSVKKKTASNSITVTCSSLAVYAQNVQFWSQAIDKGTNNCYTLTVEGKSNYKTVGWEGSYDVFTANHLANPGDIYTAVRELIFKVEGDGAQLTLKRKQNGSAPEQIITVSQSYFNEITTSSASVYRDAIEFWSKAVEKGPNYCYRIEVGSKANFKRVGFKGSSIVTAGQYIVKPGDSFQAFWERIATFNGGEGKLEIIKSGDGDEWTSSLVTTVHENASSYEACFTALTVYSNRVQFWSYQSGKRELYRITGVRQGYTPIGWSGSHVVPPNYTYGNSDEGAGDTYTVEWGANRYNIVFNAGFDDSEAHIGDFSSHNEVVTMSEDGSGIEFALPTLSTNDTSTGEVKYKGHKLKTGTAGNEAWANSDQTKKFAGSAVTLKDLLDAGLAPQDGSIREYTINLYAQWDESTYNVAYSNGGNDKHSGAVLGGATDGSGLYGAAFALPSDGNVKDLGYAFKGWKATIDGVECAKGKTFGTTSGLTNPAKISDLMSAASAADNMFPEDGATITLTAQWETLTYSLTYDASAAANLKADPNGNAKPAASGIDNTFTIEDIRANSGAGNDKTKIKHADLPYFGYDFNGWSGGVRTDKVSSLKVGTSIDENMFKQLFCTSDDANETAAQSVVLSASWNPWEYTITWRGNGAAEPDTNTTAKYDAAVEVPGFTRAGYTFGGFRADSDTGNIVSSGNVWEVVAASTTAKASTTGPCPIVIIATWSEDSDGGKYKVEFYYQDPEDGTFKVADTETLHLSAPITQKPSIENSDTYKTSEKFESERFAHSDTYYVFDKANTSNNLVANTLTVNEDDNVLKAYYKLALQVTLTSGSNGSFGPENAGSVTLPASGYYNWSDKVKPSELLASNVAVNTDAGLHATNRLEWEASAWPTTIEQTALTKDATFEAQWSQIEYTLNYVQANVSADGDKLDVDSAEEGKQTSSSVSGLHFSDINGGYALKGQTGVVPDFGYSFKGWLGSVDASSDALVNATFDDVFKAARESIEKTGVVSESARTSNVYGACTPKTYTLNFYRNLDSKNADNTPKTENRIEEKSGLSVAGSANVDIPSATSEAVRSKSMYGYALADWRTDAGKQIALQGTSTPLQDIIFALNGGKDIEGNSQTFDLFAGWCDVYRAAVPVDSEQASMEIDVIKINETKSTNKVRVYNYSPVALKLAAKSSLSDSTGKTDTGAPATGEALAEKLFGADRGVWEKVNLTFDGVSFPLYGADKATPLTTTLDGIKWNADALGESGDAGRMEMSGIEDYIYLSVDDPQALSVVQSTLASANAGAIKNPDGSGVKRWGKLADITWTLDTAISQTPSDVWMFKDSKSAGYRPADTEPSA